MIEWCQNNSFALNVSRTKEQIIDFRRGKLSIYELFLLNGMAIERIKSFKFLDR